MIQFSFSPNWYRPQCIAFSLHEHSFYYSSNCILYKYDLTKKRIISELNLKQFLLKQQGYLLSSFLKQIPSSQTQTKNQQKDSYKKENKHSQKSQGEKQKILKISALSLIQTQQENFLVVGFNCIGVILIIQVLSNGFMVVKQMIDASKINPEFNATESIHVCHHKQAQKEKSGEDYRNQVHKIIIFSSDLFQAVVTLETVSVISKCLLDVSVNNPLKIGTQGKNRIKNKNLQIKLISREQLNKNEKQEKQDSDISSPSNQRYLVLLSSGINTQEGSQSKNHNFLLFDGTFENILAQNNLDQLVDLAYQSQNSFDTSKQYSGNPSTKETKSFSTILSADSIRRGHNASLNQYIVLTKNNSEKPNLFCEKFHLTLFDSNILQLLSNEKTQPNKQQTKILYRIPLEIIYPKKCHHKLSQQQKSTLSIKFINNETALLTGRIGQMFLLNLKQIQLKLQRKEKSKFTLSLRPYSYEQQKNPFWILQPSQKHYKDVYAIYRVPTKLTINNQTIPKNCSLQKASKTVNFMHLIGTDHILTTWKISQKQEKPQIQNCLAYQSNIKFLTSAVDQIILSEPEPSLVFLRLRDSNIRSFEPFAEKGNWLNQFWKHTSHSFSKQIQKLVMHSTQIGVACMVSREGKIILYDLYEERLVRLIEIRQKTKPKASKQVIAIKGSNNKGQIEDGKFNNKDKNTLNTNKSSNSNKNVGQSKCIQINSISFEHISIIKALESFYESQEFSDSILTEETIKQNFEFIFQSFYQRQLNSSVVLLIQSNEYVFIIRSLDQQAQLRRFQVFKKIYKLERIYKTKYWDGSILLGTRKRKGELLVGLVGKCLNSKSKTQKAYKFIQKQIQLPLGTSSRYLFKLSDWPNCQEKQNNGKEETKKYVLSVISYKGTKLTISIFKLSIRMRNTSEEQAVNFCKLQQPATLETTDNLSLQQLFRSEEIQVPNLNSQNSMGILIEHLVVSQQENEYLIAVYNNQFQTINVIDFKQLIQAAISNRVKNNVSKKQVICENAEEIGVTSQKMKQNSISKQMPYQEGEKINHEQKLQVGTRKVNPKRDINCLSEKQQTQLLNTQDVQSLKSSINVHQFSGLSYKIESVLFHKRNEIESNPEDSSHMIILGKDQSVRLLELQPFVQLTHQSSYYLDEGKKNVNRQTREKYENIFKYKSKTVQVQAFKS